MSSSERGWGGRGVAAVTEYLHPFVPGEKAKWHQRVTHEHPVDSLLQHVEEGLQGSDGGQGVQRRAVPNQIDHLS